MPHTDCPRRLLSGIVLLSMVAAHPVQTASGQDAGVDGVGVRVTNPLPLARPSETIELDWRELVAQIPELSPNRVRVLDVASGEEVVTQAVDGDGDGETDQLLFQSDLWPNEARIYRVEGAASSLSPESRAYAAHIPERDDLAWENDRVAFRTYGQGLWELEDLISSGVDVWLKRTNDLVIDRWYGPDHGSYHVDTGEGADFYTVGPSLGGGGTAIWHDGQLYPAENFAAHRILANGPIRTIFELDYEAMDVGGNMISSMKRIALDAGHYLYRQEMRFASDAVDELTYAIGTVRREGLVGSTSQANDWAWLSTWGPVNREAGGHGQMGTAALLNGSEFVGFEQTDDHYLATATATTDEAAIQYAGAAWTVGSEIDSVEDWWAYLDAYAQRLAAPVEVTYLTD